MFRIFLSIIAILVCFFYLATLQLNEIIDLLRDFKTDERVIKYIIKRLCSFAFNTIFLFILVLFYISTFLYRAQLYELLEISEKRKRILKRVTAYFFMFFYFLFIFFVILFLSQF